MGMAAHVPNEPEVVAIIVDVYQRVPRERELAPQQIGALPLFSLEEGEDSLGLDSLDAVEIATELEEAFDLVLPTEIDPMELRTLRQVMELLERLHAEQHGAA
jgi:acyl carrier protein